MTYIENVFVMLAAPLVACLFVVPGRGRVMVASTLSGMLACLLSSYVSSFFAQWVGADAVAAAVEVAPVVEETIKILPLLYYLLVLEPSTYEGDAAAIFVSVGFATMESAYYLMDSGHVPLTALALRGLSAAMMHLTCGVIMGFGITHVWDRAWMKVSGTLGLLSLVIAYHGLYNLLIAAEGPARIVALALPLTTLTLMVMLRQHRHAKPAKEQ